MLDLGVYSLAWEFMTLFRPPRPTEANDGVTTKEQHQGGEQAEVEVLQGMPTVSSAVTL